MKWGEEETIKFVELYEKYECLWNYKNSDYKEKSARNRAYQQILHEMNIPGFSDSDLRTKIRNIRSTYIQEVAKIKRTKKESTLKWFKIAHRFLSTVVTSKNAFNNFEPLKIKVEPSTNISSEDESLEIIHNTYKKPKQRKISDNSKPELNEKTEEFKQFDKVKEDEFFHFGNNVACQLRELNKKDAVMCQMEIMQLLTKYRIKSLEGREN